MIDSIGPEIRRRAYTERGEALFRGNPMIRGATVAAGLPIASKLYGVVPIIPITNGEWVLTRAVRARFRQLTRQFAGPLVNARRTRAHTGARSGQLLLDSLSSCFQQQFDFPVFLHACYGSGMTIEGGGVAATAPLNRQI